MTGSLKSNFLNLCHVGFTRSKRSDHEMDSSGFPHCVLTEVAAYLKSIPMITFFSQITFLLLTSQANRNPAAHPDHHGGVQGLRSRRKAYLAVWLLLGGFTIFSL